MIFINLQFDFYNELLLEKLGLKKFLPRQADLNQLPLEYEKVIAKSRKMSSEGILSPSLTGKNKCKLCGKSFIHIEDLLRHQRTIHREKAFKCHLCPTRLQEKITLLHIKEYAPPIKPLTESIRGSTIITMVYFGPFCSWWT